MSGHPKNKKVLLKETKVC